LFDTDPKWIVVFVAGAIIAVVGGFSTFPGRPSLPLLLLLIGIAIFIFGNIKAKQAQRRFYQSGSGNQ